MDHVTMLACLVSGLKNILMVDSRFNMSFVNFGVQVCVYSGNDMSRKCPISYIFNVSLTVLNALLQQPDVF